MARSIKPFQFFTNFRGQDENTGEMLIQPGAARLIQNMHMDSLGQWSAYNQGYTALTAQLESGARINSLYWFVDSTGTDYLLASVGTKIKTVVVVGGATADISSSFTTNQPVDFETFKGVVYAASAGLALQKWTGTGSMSAASGFPLINGSETYDKPSIVEKYANRLVTADFHGAALFPSHVVLSDDLAPETYTIGTSATNAVVFQVAPGDGQSVKAVKTFNLPFTNEQLLLIFKDRSIYSLSGNTPVTFALNLVNSNFGCLNNRCAVQVGNDVLFMDINGVYSITTANTSGTMQPKAIASEMILDTLATMNLTQKDKAFVVHLPGRREVWFHIPTGSSSEPDTVLVYHYNTDPQGNPVNAWSVRTGYSPTSAVIYNKTFYSGNSTGYVNQWFGSSNYNGTGYNYIYRYPFFNFGTQAQNKRVVECYIWLKLFGNESFTVTTEWRGGGNNTRRSVAVVPTLPSGIGVYGTGIYGTSIYGSSAGVFKKVRVPVLGNGEQLQISISGTTSNNGPIILGVSGLVEYTTFYSRKYA